MKCNNIKSKSFKMTKNTYLNILSSECKGSYCKMKWFFVHVLFGIFISRAAVAESGKCGTKLLNDYEKVPDSAFRSTSYFIHPDHLTKKADFSAKAARENYDKDNQEYAWCPLNQVETSLSEYLEIDLGRLTMVKVVQTKGRFAQGAGKEFTPYYRIRYSRDSGQQWRDYKKFKDKGFEELLSGPIDAFLDAFETLDPPIVARLVRIFPYSHISKRVCLKLQLFGCDFTNNLLEYRMLQGTPAIITHSVLSAQPLKSSQDVLYPCIDNAYDGNYYGGRLRGGLGLLTDNNTGEHVTNKTKDLLHFVGWHKNSFSQVDEFISVTFVFVNSRNFSSVKIYSYSNPQLQIDYFSQINISSSDDDIVYRPDNAKEHVSQHFLRTDHSIEINLIGHYGRYVKINFYFQSQWMLLSEILFNSVPRIKENRAINRFIDNDDRGRVTNTSQPYLWITNSNKNSNFQTITKIPPKYIEKPVSLEIIYLLSILLCLLLGVITAICSFWIIIKRKRTQRKKVIKKQALALCTHNSFIPYNHHSNSLQCLATSLPPVTMSSRGNYPSYTVDRRNYPNGTVRTVTNLAGGYHLNSSSFDQNGIANKNCNGDSNIYTSIVGSDNDSSLSPEYATTSVTNDPIFHPSYSETPTSYLPPPIEPIRSDSVRSNNDRQSLYYPHPSTLPSPQDSVNIWRINNINNTDIENSYNSPNQMSFSDFSYLKYNHPNLQDNFGTNTSSKYAELPCINSHF